MKKTKYISVLFLIISIIVFIISIYANRTYFNTLSIDNVLKYQIRQVLSVIFLFIMGYLFLKALQNYFSDLWILLLSFPCGVALWVFVSFAILSLDIVYYSYRVYLIISLVIFSCFFVRKIKKVNFVGSFIPTMPNVCYILGIALLVSCGWNYVIMNYDSYLYFTDYGKTLTILQEWKAFSNENSYVLTNIGQFLPLVNSYSTFWGLDYCLSVQSFLIINTILIFAFAIFEYMTEKVDNKKAIAYMVLFLLLFVSCTPLLVYSNWLLSNAFLMVYLFLALLLGGMAPQKMTSDCFVTITGSVLAITLLRKDGIIITCFIFICYCCKKLWNEKMLIMAFLIPVFVQLYYIFFIRKVLNAGTLIAPGTSILNTKFVLMILAAIVGTLVFILWIYPLLTQKFNDKVYNIILLAMILAVVVAILIKPIASVNHIDAIMHVLTGSSYGLIIFTWGVLLCCILLKRPKIEYNIFSIVGYCLLVFLIYWNKDNTEKGIDNSGMRAFYQIIPMMYYIASIKIFHLFIDKKDK